MSLSEWLEDARRSLTCWWRGHSLEMVDHLSILARVHCTHCGHDFLLHRYDSGMAKWTEDSEKFFAAHRLICERWSGCATYPPWNEWK